MKVRILGNVKHDNAYLEKYEVYDLPEEVAKQLLEAKEAEEVDAEKKAADLPPKSKRTPKFDAKKNGGYVAEAVIDADKRKKLEDEGKLNDDTPVTGKDETQPKDTTPEPVVSTEVQDASGKTLTEEEIRAREAAAAAGDTGEQNSVSDLQNGGTQV